jgi:hypothetical protein
VQHPAVIRDAVIHLNNEQPLVVDLHELPGAGDALLHCTNVRTKNGQRPVFADDQASEFFFPMLHIRFIEVLPAEPRRRGGPDDRAAGVAAAVEADADEGELEIDEDFLRRIREV